MTKTATTTTLGYLLRKAGPRTRTYVAGYDYDTGHLLGSSKHDALIFRTEEEARQWADTRNVSRAVQVIRLVRRPAPLAPNPADAPAPSRPRAERTVTDDEVAARVAARRAARKADR